MSAKRRWSAADTAWLVEHYADTPAVILRAAFARSDAQIYAKAHAIGLHKTPEYLASELGARLRNDSSIGAPWRFKPGHRTWNTGLKGVTGMHPNTAANHFRPGQKPHTWRPVGSLRVSQGYLQRKLTDTGYPPRDWVPVHRTVWEAARGPIPAGHRVVFKARKPIVDEAAIVPEALECITLAEAMRRNSVHTLLPKPLAQLVQLRGALARQINRKARQQQQDEEHQPQEAATS